MAIAIEPDRKDWTWVLDRPCPECGYDARATPAVTVAARLREQVGPWCDALSGPPAVVGRRPAPQTWSVLEYGCHVRDVCRVFDERVGLMTARDRPLFANWDQDATAAAEDYAGQDPARVAAELAAAAATLADRFDRVGAGEWTRRGSRSDGSEFTVDSLARYFLHDLVHHLHDIRDPHGDRP